ncbi:MAG: response regulator [Spirochaetes bacterium]|nr:response regulator [Spirochaetota bacterium]
MMKNILTVDDSPTVRTSVEFALKGLGHTIVHAENGKDALEKYNELKNRGESLALCIVDVNMPVMDGITFVKEFRKFEKFVPIIILTTESSDSKIEEGKQAGASGWMVKPFSPEELVKIVTRFVR